MSHYVPCLAYLVYIYIYMLDSAATPRNKGLQGILYVPNHL